MRLNFQSVPMEHYLVELYFRRRQRPAFEVDFDVDESWPHSTLILKVTNVGRATAKDLIFYISFAQNERVQGTGHFRSATSKLGGYPTYIATIGNLHPGITERITGITLTHLKVDPIKATVGLACEDYPFDTKHATVEFNEYHSQWKVNWMSEEER